ncbi:MAG: leucine-rich repeat protein, partial [Clostridia bacterium]|nr:leucine-rich repeat protein [Clostridia bacterium]
MKKIRLLVILTFICACLAVLTCCGMTTLSTPENFKVDETTLMLSWDSVKGAKGYKVYVNNEEYNTSKPRYPLDPLAPGEYSIVVKAVGVSDVSKDSKPSKTYNYVRPTESGLTYTLINNKTEYEIRGLGSAAGDIVIEDFYRGKPITQIGDMAFANKSKDVTSVKLGKNIRSIGDRAFYNCSLLESIELPDSVKEIGAYAFQGCRSLTSVSIPDGVTEICSYAFAYCRGLTSVEIPEGVVSIGERAFMGCDVLDNVVIPDSVMEMGIYAFSESAGLSNVVIGDGLETIPEYTFLNCVSLKSVTFGSSLKNIDQYAFSGCITLQSVELPDSVEKIGLAAFINCILLQKLEFGDNLTSVGASVCANSLLWASSDGIVYVDGWVLGRNSADLTEVVIPSDAVGIADRAFYECDKEWSPSGWALTIPDSVKYIGEYAFYKTTQMASLKLGTGMVSVGVNAFAHGKILRNVIISEGLEVIDNYAFQACSRLKLDKLPSTLKRIGTYAFEGTPNWTNAMSLVYIDNWLVGCVNAGLQNAMLKEDTRGIADYAFHGAVALSKVVIPETVKYIGRCAFRGCTNLSEVMLPLGLETIEDFTFFQCTALTEIYIPQTVENKIE